MLLHGAGRIFDAQRYTTKEMAAMLAEDRMKDEQYAALVAARSRGKLETADVLRMMDAQTVLSPEDAVAYGFADTVLDD
jgi:ATP-dependent protease ClpP protease subunit